MTHTSSKDAASLALPRILCLHGGGVSAEIFQTQCRGIISRLASTFRLVFVDGPFPSEPHPAIVPVFGDCGPFWRWLRWNSDDEQDVDAEAMIMKQLQTAMDEDPGTGDWVGILGFSQGAKIAASVLWAQEKLKESKGPFKFGVIMAGRAPIVVIDPEKKLSAPVPHTAGIGEMSTDFTDWAPDSNGEHALSIPTLHVHGTQDPGIDLHRAMAKNYCKKGTTREVEWDGGHRLPIRTVDVELVVGYMLDMAEETGALD